MTPVCLTVAYDGSSFFGWQKTKEGPSIEASLENALKTILKHEVQLNAASRTDRGVHAKGQLVVFSTPLPIHEYKLREGLNALLPPSIAVTNIATAPASFHPTLHNKGKLYSYSICRGIAQLPFYQNTSWHVHHLLDLHKMEKGATNLIGHHDFSAFQGACDHKKESKSPFCTLQSISFEEKPYDRLILWMKGDRFLYKMARTIAGTLVQIGLGKIDPSEVKSILEKKERTLAGMTAPARGLCLEHVYL